MAVIGELFGNLQGMSEVKRVSPDTIGAVRAERTRALPETTTDRRETLDLGLVATDDWTAAYIRNLPADLPFNIRSEDRDVYKPAHAMNLPITDQGRGDKCGGFGATYYIVHKIFRETGQYFPLDPLSLYHIARVIDRDYPWGEVLAKLSGTTIVAMARAVLGMRLVLKEILARPGGQHVLRHGGPRLGDPDANPLGKYTRATWALIDDALHRSSTSLIVPPRLPLGRRSPFQGHEGGFVGWEVDLNGDEGFFFLDEHPTINDIKAIIKQYGGVLVELQPHAGWFTTLNGANPMASGTIRPPSPTDHLQGLHLVYCCAFDGDRILFPNSWSRHWGINGWGAFSENYVPFMYNSLVFKNS